jgi:hypothetical protein
MNASPFRRGLAWSAIAATDYSRIGLQLQGQHGPALALPAGCSKQRFYFGQTGVQAEA